MLCNPDLSLLMKHLVIGQRQKAPNFSVFHWSPHGILVFIGQHFVTMRVVHLPKRTETSLITESDRNGTNHRMEPVRAVHSCNSCFFSAAIINFISKGSDSGCTSRSGHCQEDSLACTGSYHTGLCSGHASRRCCIPSGGSSGIVEII